MNIQAVLFDIDNTLILFNEAEFFKAYFKAIAPAFSDLFEADQFGVQLMHASRALMENRGQSRNVDYFLSVFKDGATHDPAVLWARFTQFYETVFPGLNAYARAVPGLLPLFDALQRRDLRLVAASNPVWPLAVQKMRVSWSGLDPAVFDHYTGIENSRYMKPQPEFFKEIAQALNIAPQACLMVGNDPLNDMAAKAAGMWTYLTLDSAPIDPDLLVSRQLHAGLDHLETPDGSGLLAALTGFMGF